MWNSPILCATPATRGWSGSSSYRRTSRGRTLLTRFGGRGYCTVFRDFVPMLEERGIPAETIELMLQDNPARMLRLAR